MAEWLEASGEASRTGAPRPGWVSFHGGPAYVRSGLAEAIVDLEPGDYAWACFSPDEHGTVHALSRGQAAAFTVRARAQDAAPSAPRPSATIHMLDHAYELSAPLEPGRQIVRVPNDGADPHHVLVFRLLPEKTMADYTAWLGDRMQGEPPAVRVGGMAEMSGGTEAFLELDLTAGEYVLVCLVAGRDEIPHVAKGMIRHVRILSVHSGRQPSSSHGSPGFASALPAQRARLGAGERSVIRTVRSSPEAAPHSSN